MDGVFVLCDPLFLVPPAEGEADKSLIFWVRLIEWAADRRLRIGPALQGYASQMVAEQKWPQFTPPSCPASLSREARQAFTEMLTRVVTCNSHDDSSAPTLKPVYCGPAEAGDALSRDARSLESLGLMGLATDPAHWQDTANAVNFDPPPPEKLLFVTTPGARLDCEKDAAVSLHMQGRRIYIVGGRPSPQVMDTLDDRFGVSADMVCWIFAGRKERMNRNALDTLRPSDVVFCITGYVAHPDWEATQVKCARWGVELREVEKRNEIISNLYERHGLDGT